MHKTPSLQAYLHSGKGFKKTFSHCDISKIFEKESQQLAYQFAFRTATLAYVTLSVLSNFILNSICIYKFT